MTKKIFYLLWIWSLITSLHAKDPRIALSVLPDPDIFDGSLTKPNLKRGQSDSKNKEKKGGEDQKEGENTQNKTNEGGGEQANQKAAEDHEGRGGASGKPIKMLEKPRPVKIGDSSLMIEQVPSSSSSDIIGVIPEPLSQEEGTKDEEKTSNSIGSPNKNQQRERSSGVERGEVIPPGI